MNTHHGILTAMNMGAGQQQQNMALLRYTGSPAMNAVRTLR
jgi:hypothetical protein